MATEMIGEREFVGTVSMTMDTVAIVIISNKAQTLVTDHTSVPIEGMTITLNAVITTNPITAITEDTAMTMAIREDHNDPMTKIGEDPILKTGSTLSIVSMEAMECAVSLETNGVTTNILHDNATTLFLDPNHRPNITTSNALHPLNPLTVQMTRHQIKRSTATSRW